MDGLFSSTEIGSVIGDRYPLAWNVLRWWWVSKYIQAELPIHFVSFVKVGVDIAYLSRDEIRQVWVLSLSHYS
jgi:hypothetical protein